MSIHINHLGKVQKAAYLLMREDARFLFSIVDLNKNEKAWSRASRYHLCEEF